LSGSTDTTSPQTFWVTLFSKLAGWCLRLWLLQQHPARQQAKTLVQHKDITSLSIYANQLVEKAKQVFHGVIREVSLVLSGANPGALIDKVAIAHADGSTDILEDEAIIYTGLVCSTKMLLLVTRNRWRSATENDEDAGSDETDGDEEAVEHAADSTIQEIYDSLDP
jgi:hypothetical protein